MAVERILWTPWITLRMKNILILVSANTILVITIITILIIIAFLITTSHTHVYDAVLLTEEKKMLYGGDIILTPQQREMITEMKLKQSGEGGVEKRAVIKSIRSLWPNGLLPYTISSQLGTF